jgi:fatty acid/phospholipid biosynthesis enzyme
VTGKPHIAIDAMGGDEGVRVMMAGVAEARRRHDGLRFLLVGDEARIKAALDSHPNLRAASEISTPMAWSKRTRSPPGDPQGEVHLDGAGDRRREAGNAGAAVSAGNTGALMAMAKLALRTMTGIDRPALAALLPTLGDNDVVMLDLGANTECDARNLVQFAVMGAAYARAAMDLDRPRVRLLNIGTEDLKGTDEPARCRRDTARQPAARDAVRRLYRRRQAGARRGGRDRERRLFRQYRAQDGGGHGALRYRPAAPQPSPARPVPRSASSSQARPPTC